SFARTLLLPELKENRKAYILLFSDGSEIASLSRKEKEKLYFSLFTGRTQKGKQIEKVLVNKKSYTFSAFLQYFQGLSQKERLKISSITWEGRGFSLTQKRESNKKYGGLFDPLERILIKYQTFQLERRDNVGISSFRVRRKLNSLREYEAFMKVQNYSSRPQHVRVRLNFYPIRKGRLDSRKRLLDLYTKGEEIKEEEIFLDFDLAKGEKKVLLFPHKTKLDEEYAKKGYEKKSGLYFLDTTYQESGKTYTLPFEGGVLESEILILEKKGNNWVEKEDFFHEDNRFYAFIPKPKRNMVYWINGSGNHFLRALLEDYQEVERLEIPAKEYLSTPKEGKKIFLQEGVEGKRPEVVIFDRCEVGIPLPPGKYIFINTDGEGVPVEFRKDKEGIPEILEYPMEVEIHRRDHPLLKYVNLEDTFILRARALKKKLPKGTTVLASVHTEKGESPLLLAHKSKDYQWVYLSIDPRDSLLVLRPSFVFLILNSIQWLVDSDKGSFGTSIKTGELFLAHHAEDRVITPSGKVAKPIRKGYPLYEAKECGIYQILYSPVLQSIDFQKVDELWIRLSSQEDPLALWFQKGLKGKGLPTIKGEEARAKWLAQKLSQRLFEEDFKKIPGWEEASKNLKTSLSRSHPFWKGWQNRRILEKLLSPYLRPGLEEYGYLASNLASSQESLFSAKTDLEIGELREKEIKLAPKEEIWIFLALLGLVVLILEWFFFTKYRLF
ncbi:MAG: hypothetical protein D6785_02170, partial [Planctomycetota bacterium]